MTTTHRHPVSHWQRMALLASLVVMVTASFLSTPFGVSTVNARDTTSGGPHGTPGKGSDAPTSANGPSITVPLSAADTVKAGAPKDVTKEIGAKPNQSLSAPFTVLLTPNTAIHGHSSDDTLDIDVPATAILAADMTDTKAGPHHLLVTQIAPASGSTNGGHFSLGTYLVQVQDRANHEVASGVGLRSAVTFTYHLPSKVPAIDLAHVQVVINGPVQPVGLSIKKRGELAKTTATPTTVATAPMGTAGVVGKPAPKLGTAALQAAVVMNASSTTFNFAGASPEAYFGKADELQANLNGGGLSDTLPLDIPSGPGGLTPPLQLAYNSANVAANHDNASPAGWVGEGWDLDVGAITWSQTNRGSCNGCSSDWESSWHLSDPYGTSAELIPPTTTTDTYYDTTTNAPNADKVFWYTAPEQHVKIVSYTNPTVDCTHFPQPNAGCTGPTNYASQPPCYRVWLANGIMEEFGCTPDSLQYYPAGTSKDEFMISAWKLDLVTDPSGNQIHFKYAVDTATNPNVTWGQTYPRDVVLSTVEWNSPTCHDAQTMCTGAAWQPLFQAQFTSSNTVNHATGTTCGAAVNGVRCDDPQKTDAAPAPLVTSTQLLDDLTINARLNASGSWNRLRRYQFNYSQTASTTMLDPLLDQPVGIAGNLLLTQFQQFGTDDTASSSYPAQTFGYTQQTESAVNMFVQAGPTAVPINRYLGNTGQGYPDDHWDTTGGITAAYHFEETNGWAISNQVPQPVDTVPLYGCLVGGWDHMLSTFSNCEGQQFVRLEGYIYINPPTGVEVHMLYRCGVVGTGDHFMSQDPNCEGQGPGAGLGWVMNAQHQPCGPNWNTNCYQWAQTTNTQFLTSLDNGQGQTQTFSWAIAHNNTHHPYQGATLNDPLACDGHENVWPCNVADDGAWSQAVLTARSSTTQDAANRALTSTWTYTYSLTNLTSKQCADCDMGMYWGDENNGDYADFYDGVFKGFNTVVVHFPDSHPEVHQYYTTEGWGLYNTGKVGCQNGYRDGNGNLVPCSNSPAWDLGNAASGREYLFYSNAAFSATQWGRNKQVEGTYTAVCPPGGVAGSPASATYGDWDGHLVSELNPGNPVAACDVELTHTKSIDSEGVVNTTPITDNNTSIKQVQYTYDFSNSYGHLMSMTTTGNNLTMTPTTTTNTAYVWNDSISTSGLVPTGTYLVDSAASSETGDGATILGCHYAIFDGLGFTGGTNSGLTRGLTTTTIQKQACLTTAPWVTTTSAYNAAGDQIAATDADATSGITSHKASSCAGQTTTCQTFDANYGTMPATSTNSLNQMTRTSYDTSAAYGFGLWPKSSTDANSQVSSTTYDKLGRVTSTTAPGEGTGLTTSTMTYQTHCTSGSALACLEVDAAQRLNATTSITTRAFYDGVGRLLETRKPGPSSQDVIQYALYDIEGNQTFLSLPFFVAAGTGYVTPTLSELGKVTTYNQASQPLTQTDPLGDVTSTAYGMPCNIAGTNGDLACYSATTVTDANGHQSANYVDALGRTIYTQQWTGTVAAGNLALYRTIQEKYDVLGRVVETDYADGSHKATAQYDAMDRKTSFSDPDLGTYQLTYDSNGNLLTSVDPRGATGTIYQSYDGLNRLLTKSTHSDNSSPLATYSYDSIASGNVGIGHLTGETFASGPNQSVTGSYIYTYDARGRQTGWTMTLGSKSYPFQTSYNDADQPLALTYPDGDVVTTSYSQQDWLAGVIETKGSTTNTLLNSVAYAGTPGAAMKPSQAVIGNNTYQWNLSYDNTDRLTHTTVKQVANSATLFDQTRTFDAVGNVISTNTTLSQGTDNQTFCYDGLNRLVWAGDKGTAPSGCTSPTVGTLTSAQYTQAYSYDVLNRLMNGPKGSGYSYGDAHHLDAVTTAPSYSATYDASGNMVTRNGQQLGYDALRRLITWQNTATSPTQTASYAYNGEGERVQQVVTSSGTATTTAYVGTYEDVSTTGSTTTTTKYYQLGSVGQAESVNGTISYQVTDDLGSVSQTLTASGGVQATELYAPYGAVRYSNGTMPTSYGYTHQRQDPSGLDYYHARFYDASVGQFISADYLQDNLANALLGTNRYWYVKGNPETEIDPDGHCWLVCAAIAGVVGAAIGATASIVTQAVQNHGNINWGTVGKTALVAGVTTAAVVAFGPLAEGALGGLASTGGLSSAVGGAVSAASSSTSIGAGLSAMASSGITMGGFLGAQQGLVTGIFSGQQGFQLGITGGISGLAGMLGGGLGDFAGKLATASAGRGIGGAAFISNGTKRVIGWIQGATANGLSNYATQVLTGGYKQPTGLFLSMAVGSIIGYLAPPVTFASGIVSGVINAALDAGSNYTGCTRLKSCNQ